MYTSVRSSNRVFYWMTIRHVGAIDGRSGPERYAWVFVNALWAVVAYLAIDLIDTEVVRAADRFREVFAGSDEEFDDEVYRLSTMPARPALLVWAVSFAVFSYLSLTQMAVADLESPAARLVQWPFLAFSYASGPLLIYHTVRLLSGVSRLLRSGNVNIFHLRPLYGFSRVTARVGVAYLVVMILNTLSEAMLELGGGTAELWIGFVMSFVLATTSFVVPLVGTHRRIVDAKSEALEENSEHLEEIRSAMYEALARGDTERFRGLDDALDGLLKMGKTIDDISAWPWSKGTLRGFFTAIGIPLVVFMAQRILDAVL
jgi:hypothetical protein